MAVEEVSGSGLLIELRIIENTQYGLQASAIVGAMFTVWSGSPTTAV
jgi:hypothetical protein